MAVFTPMAELRILGSSAPPGSGEISHIVKDNRPLVSSIASLGDA